MIVESGVESVSVRKVADKAGYSLGTIYNHFKNLDDLLWLTREVLLEDLAEYMILKKQNEICSLNDIKHIYHILIDYFIEQPNTYHFFYNYKLDKTEKPEKSILDEPTIQKEFANTFSFILKNSCLSANEIAIRQSMIIFSMLGMLSLYISGNESIQPENIHDNLNKYIELLLGDF